MQEPAIRKESVSRKKSTSRRDSVTRKKSTSGRKQSISCKRSSVVSYCARSLISPQYAHVIKSVEKFIRKEHSEQKWNEIL